MSGNEAPFPEPIITRVEESRIEGYYPSTGDWVRLEVDSNGKPVIKQVDSNGNVVDPATEGTIANIASALVSNAGDEIRVATPSAIDVSAATVPTEQQTPVKLEDSQGTTIDPLASGDEPLDVSGATVTVTDNGSFSVSSGPLDGSLGSNASDYILVEENNPLDVSGATVTVTDDGSLAIASTPLDAALASNANDELRTDIQSAGIKVPTDQQDALEKTSVNYGQDETNQQQFSLTLGGYSFAHVKVSAVTSTTITVEESFDGGSNWETYRQVSGTEFEDKFDSGATDIRVTTDAAGTSGDTVDIIISGKP